MLCEGMHGAVAFSGRSTQRYDVRRGVFDVEPWSEEAAVYAAVVVSYAGHGCKLAVELERVLGVCSGSRLAFAPRKFR